MKVLYSASQQAHAPAFEFFRGERVPCFETPQRAEFVLQALHSRGHDIGTPQLDSSALLPQVHAPRYLGFLQSAWDQWLALDPGHGSLQPFPSVWPVRSLRSDVEPDDFIARLGLYSMDNGSPLSAGTWGAAKAGADAAVSAAALLAQGERSVFCLTRPPGHHAGTDFMGGYCFINNAAVAAQALLGQGCRQVAVLDVDYHHGNGTQSIFYERAEVLVVSLHGDPRTEYPFYLGHADEHGAAAGLGFNLNLPLPAGASVAQWFDALETACARVQRHAPEALVVSLGLDTFAGDPISRFHLQTGDFLRLGARLKQLNCPTLFVLEGGYAARELGVNAAQVLEGFEQG
jgi:acetoin utilization deacetylase AcuC-like enzyme